MTTTIATVMKANTKIPMISKRSLFSGACDKGLWNSTDPRSTLHCYISIENYQEARFLPGNAMMNTTVSYSEEAAGRERTEASNVSASHETQVYSRFGGVSQMQDIQDFGSWRDQASDRSGFQLMNAMAGPMKGL
ncbi:hypothetical protein F2Q69_00057901 [Brassica cretica]|uniref:Uncharacterized protein n=1 Tax=Brassica cretica TaxID=69181 RepID=A0A8S9N973_BRACR|nr:hypothetical protein F2Q69_00057901 [Brassica cretica]